MKSKLSILVVAWNNESTLSRCLSAATSAAQGLDVEILVLDNASEDASADIAQSHGALLVRQEKNIGFACGNNALARRARGDTLVFLNPDLFLERGALDALRARLAGIGGAGIVGGMLLDPNGTVQAACARPLTSAGDLIRWTLTGHRAAWPVPNEATPVEAVSGAFMAVPHRLWRALEGFDEGFPHSSEDLDLCWRAREAGASVWFEPAARAVHVLGASVAQAPPSIDVLRWAGSLRFVRRRQGRLATAGVRGALAIRTSGALALHHLRLRRLDDYARRRATMLQRLALFGARRQQLLLPHQRSS